MLGCPDAISHHKIQGEVQGSLDSISESLKQVHEQQEMARS